MKTDGMRTAEHVGCGHPDKFADQVADRILDEALNLCGDDGRLRQKVRTAIECLAKDNLLVVSGEVTLPEPVRSRLDVAELTRKTWAEIGYGNNPDGLTVISHLGSQSQDIAEGAGGGVDHGGAGDQGIMVGYATDETPEMMPKEWVYARDLCLRLRELRVGGVLPWLKADCKSQVTVRADGTVLSVILAAQHDAGVDVGEVRRELFDRVIHPILDASGGTGAVTFDATGRYRYGAAHGAINGTGKFVIGGPIGDAGVVGRKIVVDAYGPRVPVGGGAYSGKDPTKVDRSAAYMARHIAKTIVAQKVGRARECTVNLAYGIGQLQPEMVTAVTDTGEDLSGWVRDRYPDLSPQHIIERLGLRNLKGWCYSETAAYGHYGRAQFPWEEVAKA